MCFIALSSGYYVKKNGGLRIYVEFSFQANYLSLDTYNSIQLSFPFEIPL